MGERLPADYLADAERRARKFQGQWTGTCGALGADVVRLLRERETLIREVDEMRNGFTRDGAGDLANGGAAAAACDEPAGGGEPFAADWILRGDRELREAREAGPRLTGDALLSAEAPPAERLLERALAAVRERRTSYGGPQIHFARTVGMINAAFAGVLRRPLTPSDWAIIMTLDKVARAMGPGGDPTTATADTAVDLAGYAGCFFEVQSDTP
jgi:hypothetical protein